MHLLIVAALFLIFSTACASPVYIAPRNNANAIAKLPDNEFQDLLSKGKGLELLVIGRLGGLTGVEYEGTKYQILWLLEDKQRDFKIEQGRIQRKKPLSVRKIQTKHYFVFSGDADDTFSPSFPKGGSAFQEMRKGAGEAYGEKWDSDPVLRESNENPGSFVYAKEMAVYISDRSDRPDRIII